MQGVAIIAVSFVGFFSVLVSPVLVDAFSLTGKGVTLDWDRLSSIGQTYGAAAAIFSAFAFIAVTISLIVQAGEVRSNRIQAVRGHHLELLKIVADKPEIYMPLLGFPVEMNPDAARRHIYAVLQMNYIRMAYESRVIHEAALRAEVLPEIFQNQLVRDWWCFARPSWIIAARGTWRMRKFVQIVDDEYAKAVAIGSSTTSLQVPDLDSSGEVSPSRQAVPKEVLVVALLGGIVGGVVGGAMMIRKYRGGSLRPTSAHVESR